MEFFRNHWIRIAYLLISLGALLASLKFKDKVIGSDAYLNEFSYFGVVATLVALLVAVFEVLHSVHVSKSIRDEAIKLLKQARDINGASFVSECLAVLDEANEHVSGQRYVLSLKCFQHFRRTYLRISGPENLVNEINSALGNIELGLQQATHTSPQAPLDGRKKSKIQKDILNIKRCLEEMNPAKRGEYVSS
ncbi:hypothetical protein [Thalassolituus pacificus]|uniref:Uncharacterized protein n=1 Tax=Thalassolituus pacificus TaxID=2975440 RepID=A0A9X2WCG1_9GAMM|nr:hypothetical protein [Thalassolituus pacificus]MCT7357891.1 hypothetical protein [Thalassolituus pacificus]